MSATAPILTYAHIELHEDSTPTIAGRTMKVIELVQVQQAYGWSPEELHFQFPGLSLGQIHTALAYYWDHQVALDAEIERRWQFAEAMRQTQGDNPTVQRLRDLRKQP